MLFVTFASHLIPSGHVVRHVLEAAHHPLVPEVVRKRLRPLGQQLHQLRRHLAETNLEKVSQKARIYSLRQRSAVNYIIVRTKCVS